MPTLTIRPNANGYLIEFDTQFPASGSHYDKVDEAVADDATTYIRNTVAAWKKDYFALADRGAASGIINSVKLYVRWRCDYASPGQHYIGIRTHDTDYELIKNTPASAAWGDVDNTWATNPNTSAAWTWDEIDALQAGISMYNYTTYADVTQIYVEVDYTEVPQILYPSGIEQPIALGTPAVSKLQKMILPTGIEQPTAVGTPTLTKLAPTLPDFPDWTLSVRLVGTEIFLPINVQGVSVTIPMDIKAVSIGTISVDVVAQTVGNVTISVAAQTVAVKLQGEWSTQQGEQKYLSSGDFDLGFAETTHADYTVATGKTLYITHFAFSCCASNAADADANQIGRCYLQNITIESVLTHVGGNGGGGKSFPTPIKVPSGNTLRIMGVALANHDLDLYFCWGGYEI